MTFLRVMGFSLLAMLGFMGYANILPQVQSDPPVEEVIETGSLDMAGMISYGNRLFSGKGTCTLCHNDLGRAPDLLELDLAVTFAERLADPANDGKSAELYLVESMVDPSAYVVAGFGKKGTNDTVSPMPVVNAPPIELNDVEMNALVAFLQDRAGLEPTVPLPSAEDAPQEPDEEETDAVEAPETDVLVALDKFFCAGCHDLNGSGADVGPGLNGLASRMSRALVMEAIIDPNAVIAKGYEADFMPTDFGEWMHVSELTLIVDYLFELPDEAPVAEDSEEPVAVTALEALDKFFCAGCHDLEGSEADVGPALNGISSRMSRDEVIQAILDPNAAITDGYEAGFMPDDFAEWMATSELELITDYLMNLTE